MNVMSLLVCFREFVFVYTHFRFTTITIDFIPFFVAAHCIRNVKLDRLRYVLNGVRLGENDLRTDPDCQEVREMWMIVFSILIVCCVHYVDLPIVQRPNVLIPWKIFQLPN